MQETRIHAICSPSVKGEVSRLFDRIAATCRQKAGNGERLPHLGESTPNIYGFSRRAAMATADQHFDQCAQQEITRMPSTNSGGLLVYASLELA